MCHKAFPQKRVLHWTFAMFSLLASFSFKTYIFIYLLAALGPHCRALAFSSCSKWGLLFIAGCGLLIVAASPCRAQAVGAWALIVAAHGLRSCSSQVQEHRFSSCGAQT